MMNHPDCETIPYPHALIIDNGNGDMDISPFGSYSDALDSLRDRATYWETDSHEPINVFMASIEELSNLYSAGDENAYVSIIPLEKPIIRWSGRSRILLEWPD